MRRKDLLVVALGGNALLRRGEEGSFEEQYRNVRFAASKVVDLLQKGYSIALTHGNGPQVGAAMLRHDAASKLLGIPPFPMDVCGAETQGFVGYMIQQALQNELDRRGLKTRAVSVVTRVLVDRNDPAFGRPTKPVGPYYTEEEAKEIQRQRPDERYREDSGKGWRRVVASPRPKDILEKEAIRKLVESGFVVVSAGGGGIPVVMEGEVRGVEAVIDKDLGGELLASLLEAGRLIILTDVDGAYVDYGRPGQRKLERVSYSELKAYHGEGHFRSGSMGPKVQAAMRFIEAGGEEAVISHLELLYEAVEGKAGTHVLPDAAS
ncbi:MAG: carbamate kinase [Nitrososphaerota archaeon]|nr:carbamate kinase [Nitrososphaerota archaeon]MDG6938862.1 carbamate kinase [Nitrososphaerota archaeon]